jgi:hypothetical protein
MVAQCRSTGASIPPEAMKQTPVKTYDEHFFPRVSGFSLLLYSFARFTLTLSSLPLTFTDGDPGVTPGKFFGIVLACRRVLAPFGRKNPVFDEPTKSSPTYFGKKSSPIFFIEHLLQALHGVDAPAFRCATHSVEKLRNSRENERRHYTNMSLYNRSAGR